MPYQFSFRLFPPDQVAHGVFSRSGGASPPPYDSLNVGYLVGDQRENVRRNRRIVMKSLEISRLVSCRQVHGAEICRITEMPPAGETEIAGCDSLITDIPGVFLMIQQADCQAVLLLDPERRVIANIHAGWRGSVLGIINKTVTAMKTCYQTNPADLLAAIGPSLGPCCAEFVNFRRELPEPFQKYQVRENYFDFPAISRDQLLSCGLEPANIELARICTRCDSRWFSYRRQQDTGRFCSVIGLP